MSFDMLDLSKCHIAFTPSVCDKPKFSSTSALTGKWTTKSQALLDVSSEKQEHPGSISSHPLFVLLHTCRRTESFEISYKSTEVGPEYPAVTQRGAWCSRVAIQVVGDPFQLLLLPCSDITAGYPEHETRLSGEGALSEISDNKLIPC